MAEKVRYTRRDLKSPDEFISTFGRLVAWSKENSSKVTAGLLVVLAVLALSLGTRAYFRWQESKAGAEIWPYLEQAREMLAAPAGVDPGSLAAMEQSISPLASKHKGTRAALYAQYYLGSIAFQRGDYDGSVSRFRDAIGTGKDEGIMKHLLHKGVAGSLEAKGDYAGAADSYRKAAEFAGPGMKTQTQLDEARALTLSGKKSEAVSLYRRILAENPEPARKDFIDIKMSRME